LGASATPEVSSIQNLMTVKKRLGLSSENRASQVPAGKSFAEGDGSHQGDPLSVSLIAEGCRYSPVEINKRLHVLTSVTLGWGGGCG
jgi:hypothetical protein